MTIAEDAPEPDPSGTMAAKWLCRRAVLLRARIAETPALKAELANVERMLKAIGVKP